MRSFFSGTKFKIILAVLICLLLGVCAAAVSGNGVSPLSAALSYALTPLNNLASHFAESLNDFNLSFRSSGEYIDEINSLEAELESCRQQLVDYEKMSHKLSSYEEFLEVKAENPDFEFVPASVILRDSSDIYGSFTLNQGTNDGVSVNDPVIYGSHLLGVVKKVTDNSCTVYTLFNPSVSVSAYEIRTREDCFTESENATAIEGYIKISGLSRSTPVVSGGIICTSGIGGVYPRDLIIGTVNEVSGNQTDGSAWATVKPEIDVSEVVDVFIITAFDGQSS